MKKCIAQAIGAVCLGAAGLADPAQAALVSYSYTGTLPPDFPDAVAVFGFTVTAGLQDLQATTFGYAGGTNGEGVTFAAGGFDPVLSLFDAAGDLVAEDDDGRGLVDPQTGLASDSQLLRTLDVGSYFLAISAYGNVSLGGLLPGPTGGFSGGGSFIDGEGDARSSFYAVDIVLTPLPAALPLLAAGLGGLGLAARCRA